MLRAPTQDRTGRRRRGLAALRAGVLLAGCALAFGCARGDDAGRIRELVAEGAALAERHDLERLLALTAEGFRADPGQRSRDEVRDVIAAAFYYYRRFRVLHPEPAVDIAEGGGSARASFPFLIVRAERAFPGLDELYRDPQGWLDRVGENADLYHLSLDLVRRPPPPGAPGGGGRGGGGARPRGPPELLSGRGRVSLRTPGKTRARARVRPGQPRLLGPLPGYGARFPRWEPIYPVLPPSPREGGSSDGVDLA